jgi:hypothetical protein
MRSGNWAERLSLWQGVFYLATGVWPLVSVRNFERVTGPKVDKWLVKTAGVVIAMAGGGESAPRPNFCQWPAPPALRRLILFTWRSGA